MPGSASKLNRLNKSRPRRTVPGVAGGVVPVLLVAVEADVPVVNVAVGWCKLAEEV